MAGEHEGHRRRMLERFITNGLDGFASHEVLELILMYAIPRINVNPIAHRLMERFGSLHAVLEADVGELVKVEGVGMHAAALLSLFAHMDRRLERSRGEERKRLSNRSRGKAHCLGLLAGLRQEHLYLVCLNAQMEVLQDVLIARGSLNEVPTYPRLIVEAALRANAHSVVLCHNHPGGSPIPSQADLAMTAELAQLLGALEVMMADHVIVAGETALSMVEYGLMQHEASDGELLIKMADPGGELLIRSRLAERLARKGNK